MFFTILLIEKTRKTGLEKGYNQTVNLYFLFTCEQRPKYWGKLYGFCKIWNFDLENLLSDTDIWTRGKRKDYYLPQIFKKHYLKSH